MQLAWEKTQWMIVGPLPEKYGPLGKACIRYFISTCDRLSTGRLSVGMSGKRLLARFLIDIDMEAGYGTYAKPRVLQSAAPLPEWADSGTC